MICVSSNDAHSDAHSKDTMCFTGPALYKWNEMNRALGHLNWARRTSWGWWDEWDDTVLQTQDSKFEPWRSEVEHATSRSQRLPTILTFTRGWRRNILCFFQTAETGNRTPNSGVKGSGANHYPRAPAHQHCRGRAVLKTISYRHYICLYSLMCEEQHTITYRYRWSMERDFESQCLVSKQVIASPTPPPLGQTPHAV